MQFATWESLYRDICDDFGFDQHEDSKAARLLNSLIGTRASALHILKECIANRQVTICGAGPSLKENIDRIDGTVITADEATSIVMNHQLPDIIVTDLDGNVEDQITANQEGCIVVIHANLCIHVFRPWASMARCLQTYIMKVGTLVILSRQVL